MGKKFTVTDGKLVLVLQPAEKGWYAVTSPFDPALITQAKSIEEAFLMAYDAQKCLRAARSKQASGRGSADAPPVAMSRVSKARAKTASRPRSKPQSEAVATEHEAVPVFPAVPAPGSTRLRRIRFLPPEE
jgi:antitoxin HicB